jgi:hypothetical protein
MEEIMQKIMILALVAFTLNACHSSHAASDAEPGTPAALGIPADTAVVDLTPEQLERVCTWRDGLFPDLPVGTPLCEGYALPAVPPDNCRTQSLEPTGCGFTVGQYMETYLVATTDPCHTAELGPAAYGELLIPALGVCL